MPQSLTIFFLLVFAFCTDNKLPHSMEKPQQLFTGSLCNARGLPGGRLLKRDPSPICFHTSACYIDVYTDGLIWNVPTAECLLHGAAVDDYFEGIDNGLAHTEGIDIKFTRFLEGWHYNTTTHWYAEVYACGGHDA